MTITAKITNVIFSKHKTPGGHLRTIINNAKRKKRLVLLYAFIYFFGLMQYKGTLNCIIIYTEISSYGRTN